MAGVRAAAAQVITTRDKVLVAVGVAVVVLLALIAQAIWG